MINNRRNNSRNPQKGEFQKPKDFKLTIKKLGKYLREFKIYIIISIVLAIVSSIFTILGPNKLRDLTDELTKGLAINNKEITNIMTDLKSTFNEDNLAYITDEVLNITVNKEIINKMNKSADISAKEMAEFNKFTREMNNLDKKSLLMKLAELPDSIIMLILPDITINDHLISSSDRLQFINSMAKIDNSSDKAVFMSCIETFPNSIQQILLPESTVRGVKITTSDKVVMLSKLGSLDNFDDPKEIYAKIDELPANINSLLKPKIDIGAVKKLVLFLFLLYLVSATFNFLESILMVLVSNRFAKNLRNKISKKINNLALSYFDTHTTGDILSRITNDVDTIGFSMDQCLSSLVGAIALFVGCTVMMFSTNWILAITAIVSSLLGFIFMSFILSKSQKYFTTRQIALGNLNGHIEEIYSSHNVVKAYNGNEDASKTFDELNDKVFVCNRMSQFLSGLMPSMMGFTGHFGYVSVCVVGALLVMNSHISFGVIVAFMVYVRLFTSPLSQIAQGMTSVQSIAAASERVFEFIEETEMEDETGLTKGLNIKDAIGNIEFKHVKFGYNEHKLIIKDFNCQVTHGQKIAIVGPTGSGKTTMVNLLMKFYNINDGDIIIDGISIKELKRENIHKLFIMVLQDTWLFNGTIRDNIKYNKSNVSDEELWEVLKTVGVDHFVKSLPGGLDYEISDSESISAGQKQLLTIARGMIEDAPFLILDEATSSVDTRTEVLVQKAMDKLTKGRTSFIIAHRLSTIKNADLILVMKDGNVIELGKHNELMEQNGFYAELYNSQFKN